MDMPEGWKRIERRNGAFIPVEEVPKNLQYDMDYALDLMKEMAEALEFYSLSNKQGIPFHVAFNPESEKQVVAVDATYFNKSHEVLKKFKEWK